MARRIWKLRYVANFIRIVIDVDSDSFKLYKRTNYLTNRFTNIFYYTVAIPIFNNSNVSR